MAGCARSEQESGSGWEKIKIGDLAPAGGGKGTGTEAVRVIGFDIHIVDVPAGNIVRLRNLWRNLRLEPLRFTSYQAFVANSFKVRFGRIELWPTIHDSLSKVGGQKVLTTSLVLTDGRPNDVAVSQIPGERKISFVAGNKSTQKVTMGPGVLVLRIKADKIAGVRGLCKVVAHPVFTVPVPSPIPELSDRARLREFSFHSAAFGSEMRPGDLVVLGPEGYTGKQSSLGDLFFGKPEGSLFFNEGLRKPPEHKPASRIFLLVCTRIDD